MKALVRLGAVVGIMASTLMGPSLKDMSALAIPAEQVLQKLAPVPVFTITDQIARVIESFITAYPDQWSWISKRRIRTRTKRATFLNETINPLS